VAKIAMQRSKATMYPLIQEYESGELTQKAFCHSHDLPMGVFQYWLRKYREEDSNIPDDPGFIHLDVRGNMASSCTIEIRYPDGTQISIPFC
jgi:hypothetical protein